jgi:TldD protein
VPIQACWIRPWILKRKKQLADAALNTARSLGATYADVRIGRYLNQFLNTRENKVQNREQQSLLAPGIRVIANGTWGFAATNDVTQMDLKKPLSVLLRSRKQIQNFRKSP